jgi:hypothetical protein
MVEFPPETRVPPVVLTNQFALVLEFPETVAVNCWVPERTTVVAVGEIATVMPEPLLPQLDRTAKPASRMKAFQNFMNFLPRILSGNAPLKSNAPIHGRHLTAHLPPTKVLERPADGKPKTVAGFK